MILREQFLECGVVPNVPILPQKTALRLLNAIEKIEQNLDVGFYKKVTESSPAWEKSNHPLQRICRSLTQSPELTTALCQILGQPDIMLRNVDIFIKNMKTNLNIGWHVDTPYQWEKSLGMATCWISLTEANSENGGLEYIIGSHKHRFQQHIKDKKHMSLKKKQLDEIKELPLHSINMEAGEMVVHSFRTVHRSKGNHTRMRRFAIALRVFTAKTNPEIAECGQAVLLSGDALLWKSRLRSSIPISWHIQ
jgi:hypothetical protein